MVGEPVSKTSPKGLVRRIVTAVPFPLPLKTRILLKSCWAPFSPTSSEGDRHRRQGEEVEILSEDSEDEAGNTQGEEVSNMSLQNAAQDEEEKTQGVEATSTLPDELVERILAMVPFPYLFKARALSKSWMERFSPITSQDDETKKQLAISFQKKVRELSINWKTFCPIFIDLSKGFLVYDRAAHRWQRMQLLSFLPGVVLRAHQQYPRTFILRAHQQIDGALLLLSGFHRQTPLELASVEPKGSLANLLTCCKLMRPLPPVNVSGHARPVEHKLFVANFLTRRWKELPCPRPMDGKNVKLLFKKLVSQSLLGTYKVVLFYSVFFNMERYGGRGYYLAQIYDSKSNVWRTTTLIKGRLMYRCHCAYLNGVVYMVVGKNPTDLLALNVEEGTFEELEIVGDITGRIVDGLVVCRGNLFTIVHDCCASKLVQLLKIDLKLLTLLEMARGPPDALSMDMKNTPYGSDGDCICFPTKGHKGMVVYNVLEDEWSLIRFPSGLNYSVSIDQTSFSFQPNLNPFVEV